MSILDLSYLNAAPVLLRQHDILHLVLVGCGGTGSYLAGFVARLAYLLSQKPKQVRVSFIDFDRVEPKNLARQQFCQADVGLPKAEVLAWRYAQAWGVEIEALVTPFAPEAIALYDSAILTILLGCTDNHLARRAIARCLEFNGDLPHLWWLDSGNRVNSGQVLVGSHNRATRYFNEVGGCIALPSPLTQEPLLGEPEPGETQPMSCAQINQQLMQSWTINQKAAAEMSHYLLSLIQGNLKRFATYFDLEAGVATSQYITAENLKP
jgi:PRTRC genetic system ThiF family protein